MSTEQQQFKQQAAYCAVDFVESGMVVGLGTGSTAVWAVRRIAELLDAGDLHDIVGIPTSKRTAEEAERLGIPLTTLEDHPIADVTIDGADEVDPACNVIKGGGGALLREKIVAQASQRFIVVVDESKLSPALGTNWAVPVEVVSFGWGSQKQWLETALGARVALRKDDDGTLFETDHGNMILDCAFGPLHELDEVVQALNTRAGIVEHGLFLHMASAVIVASAAGVRVQSVPGA